VIFDHLTESVEHGLLDRQLLSSDGDLGTDWSAWFLPRALVSFEWNFRIVMLDAVEYG
jgi:hypothetical protein